MHGMARSDQRQSLMTEEIIRVEEYKASGDKPTCKVKQILHEANIRKISIKTEGINHE